MKAKFIQVINVTDPDTGGEVELEVWKCPSTGGLFAIDSSFLDQVQENMPSPFDPKVALELPASDVEKATAATEVEAWAADTEEDDGQIPG